MDALAKEIKSGELWMALVPLNGILLNATGPDRDIYPEAEKEQSADYAHWIVLHILDDLHGSNEKEISHGRVAWKESSLSRKRLRAGW
jgi:hypothetical protein